MSVTFPPLPVHRRSVPPEDQFARLRLSSPERSGPQRSSRTDERPRILAHRRAYSLTYASTSTIRLPLPRRDCAEPRIPPPMRVTPPTPPQIRITASASPPRRTAACRPAQALSKQTIMVNPSLAAHLKRGGVVNFVGKDGKRMRVFLPSMPARVV